jgi:hypothetical protein
MPDTTDDEERPGEPPEEQPEPSSVRWRMAWFFGIAAVSGLAFAGAAGLLRFLLLH